MPIKSSGSLGGNPGGSASIPGGPVIPRQTVRSAGAYVGTSNILHRTPFATLLNSHPTDPTLQWNRISVPYPCILYPVRNDAILPLTTILGYLNLSYSKANPFTGAGTPSQEVPPIQSAYFRSCYLWDAGEWYIKAESAVQARIHCVEVPTDAEVMANLMFGRVGGRVEQRSITIPASPTDQILVQAQELINASQISLFPEATMVLRWEQAVAASGVGFRLIADSPWVFPLQSLPIADLWGQSTGASARTLKILIHYS